jgi:hypothetical protein
MGAFANYLTRHRSSGGSLLLDPGVLTASAGAAYSTRLLRTAYAGNCMLVRRSSDNTTLAIGFTGSPAVLNQSALTTFVGAGNGFIVTWYDQSGNGRDVTQATAAAQPQIVASGVVEFITGTIPAPLFSQTNPTVLANASPFMTAAGAATVSVVAKVTSNSAGFAGIVAEGSTTSFPLYCLDYIVGSSAAPPAVLIRNDANTTLVGPVTLGSVNQTDGSLHYSVSTDTGSLVKNYLDGTAGSSPQTYSRSGTFASIAWLGIGGMNRTALTQGINGTIAEVICFGSALGSTDLGTVYTNQSTFY